MTSENEMLSHVIISLRDKAAIADVRAGACVAYILTCADGTFYTGWTNDLPKRLKTHNAGKGAKYTKVRLPVEAVYVEICGTKNLAMSREYHIKQLSRQEKAALIRGDN